MVNAMTSSMPRTARATTRRIDGGDVRAHVRADLRRRLGRGFVSGG